MTVPGRVERIEQDPVSVSAAGISARWLLGCDGLHSTVRRLAGLEVGAGAAVREPLLAGVAAPTPVRAPLSTLARAAAIPPSSAAAPTPRDGPDPRRRFGLRRHFHVPAWTDLVEVHWETASRPT
ncbi:FAD-dependent monooxygenase [Oerskovia sp. M15]